MGGLYDLMFHEHIISLILNIVLAVLAIVCLKHFGPFGPSCLELSRTHFSS